MKTRSFPKKLNFTGTWRRILKINRMSTARSVIEKGLSQGLSQGLLQGLSQGLTKGAIIGEWIGKIHMLEQFLGVPVDAPGDYKSMSVDELEHRCSLLQAAYDEKFKR